MFRCVRLEKKGPGNPKKMLMLAFNNSVLLGCVDTKSLMMNTLRLIKKFQKKLGSIIRSNCLNGAIKSCLNKFHKGWN